MLTAAQAEQLREAVPAEVEPVPAISPPQVLAQRLGPRVDGRDPTLLHGAAYVYRLAPGRWHPAAGSSRLIDDQRGEAVPLLPAEFEAWRLDQQRLLARQQETLAALASAVAELQQALQRLSGEAPATAQPPSTGGEP